VQHADRIELAQLFVVRVPIIKKHLRNIFQTGELAEEGGNEDAALKNTKLAKKVDALARPSQPNPPVPEKA